MQVLDRLLQKFHHDLSREKVVIVSNWTTTLNMVQELCKIRKYPYLRLDGSTPQKQRQESVDRFNREDKMYSFIFLLSAKAGGMGLNLIGWVKRYLARQVVEDICSASRLVLFDSDWWILHPDIMTGF